MTKQNTKSIESLLKENIKKTDLLLQKIDKLEKDLKKFQIMSFLRFILVAIPVVLAVLYLIPLFRQFLEIYLPILEFLDNFKNLNLGL